MCKYCEGQEVIFEKEMISHHNWGWGGETRITEAEAFKDKFELFIDRGFLRFADSEDKNCLDHGDKIKINFCPFCGIGMKS